jgi:hypothetical protein
MAKNVLGGLYKKEDDKKRESLKEKEGKEMRKTESISGEINEAKIGGYYRRTHEEEKCLYHRAHTE